MYRRLKFLRETSNIKQIEICKLINIVDSQYSHYENENVTIPIKHLNTLCNYFDVSLDYIFEFTDIKQYPNYLPNIDINISAKRLKEFRKIYHLNQKKLATFLNTSFTTISSYERGINIINTNYLYSICKKYHISADYLLGKIDEPIYFKEK